MNDGRCHYRLCWKKKNFWMSEKTGWKTKKTEMMMLVKRNGWWRKRQRSANDSLHSWYLLSCDA